MSLHTKKKKRKKKEAKTNTFINATVRVTVAPKEYITAFVAVIQLLDKPFFWNFLPGFYQLHISDSLASLNVMGLTQ